MTLLSCVLKCLTPKGKSKKDFCIFLYCGDEELPLPGGTNLSLDPRPGSEVNGYLKQNEFGPYTLYVLNYSWQYLMKFWQVWFKELREDPERRHTVVKLFEVGNWNSDRDPHLRDWKASCPENL